MKIHDALGRRIRFSTAYLDSDLGGNIRGIVTIINDDFMEVKLDNSVIVRYPITMIKERGMFTDYAFADGNFAKGGDYYCGEV